MRRSICVVEPSYAVAGQVANWKFSYTTAVSLPKGTLIRFDMGTRGRDVDWETPSASLKEKANCLYLQLPNSKTLAAEYFQEENTLSDCFDFVLPGEVKAGDTLVIHIKQNQTQTYTQRRRPIYLYVDPKGKGDFRDPEIFTMDIRGGKLHTIKLVAPSLVAKNRRFDVFVRFEDEFGNLTADAPEGTLIELSYENLRENLNWKLFVPETGFINLPNLYFNEQGVYKIQLLNSHTKEKFYSTPIRCFSNIDQSIYWGLLHGESEKFDSAGSIEQCLRHFRDEEGLNFYAVSPYENAEETSNDDWKLISQQVAEFNEDNRFCTFLGTQWFGNNAEEGLKLLVFSKDNRPILRKKDVKYGSLRKIYKSFGPKELMSIPCFTMGKGFHSNFSDVVPEHERVIEIYNAWGSSECTKKEGNLRPISVEGKDGIVEAEVGSIRRALNQNHRFGFIAGGLDDRGAYAGLFEGDQAQYSAGLTAIVAPEQTREALMQALHNRSCYATTGEKIVLGFQIAGSGMGTELSTKNKPGLIFNRHITGFVSGTAKIKEIQIIRNGTVWKSIEPKDSSYDIMVDDTEHMSKFVLPAKDEGSFCYYYLRVIQEDDHIAWSSPIWIDYSASDSSQLSKKRVKKPV